MVRVLAVLLAVVSAAFASPAVAGVRGASGRLFTLAALSDPAGTSLAVGGDGTVWTLSGGGALWRLRPKDLRPARVSTPRGYADVATLPDGSLVLADPDRRIVWRRALDGSLSVAAGSPAAYDDPSLSTADGAQAAGTRICSVGPVAALPDGGFLFTDRYARTLRRVAPDGTISTLFAVTSDARAYGCATSGNVEGDQFIKDLAVGPDGAIVILLRGLPGSNDRVLRIGLDGAVAELATGLEIGSIAAAGDGSVLFTAGAGAPFPVRRLPAPPGRAVTVLHGDYGGSASLFGSDGLLAHDVFGLFFYGVAIAPDGGLVAPAEAADSGRWRIVYLAPAAPRRLAVALAARSAQATAEGYSVRYRSTRAGRARLTILTRRGRVAAQIDARARAGSNAVTLRHRLPFDRYTVRLTIVGADRQRALDAVRVFLGGRLPLSAARTLLVPAQIDVGGGCSNCEVDLRPVRDDGCSRRGARRVDCRYSYVSPDTVGRTTVRASARLRVNGTLDQYRDGEQVEGATLPSQPW